MLLITQQSQFLHTHLVYNCKLAQAPFLTDLHILALSALLNADHLRAVIAPQPER